MSRPNFLHLSWFLPTLDSIDVFYSGLFHYFFFIETYLTLFKTKSMQQTYVRYLFLGFFLSFFNVSSPRPKTRLSKQLKRGKFKYMCTKMKRTRRKNADRTNFFLLQEVKQRNSNYNKIRGKKKGRKSFTLTGTKTTLINHLRWSNQEGKRFTIFSRQSRTVGPSKGKLFMKQ